jgi:hypothetical protein
MSHTKRSDMTYFGYQKIWWNWQIDMIVYVHVKVSHVKGFNVILLKITLSAARLKKDKFRNKIFPDSFVKYY